MSTHANRTFPLAAVCTVLFALYIPGGNGQVREFIQLDPCYWPEGLFEVVENSVSNTLTCSVFDYFRVRWWYWHTNGTEGRLLGYCTRGYYCNNVYPSALFSLSVLPNGENKLRINTTDTTLFTRPNSFTNSTISCRRDDFLGISTCRTDLIYPAKDSSCSAQFQTGPTKPLVTTCNIPKAYSALQRYSCQVFIAQEAVGSPAAMVTTPLGTDYVSGSCSMTSVLSSVDGNITVMIIPGRINVTASSIRQPSSARVDHTCPEYVDEGSNLGCTCTADDRGSPPGFLQWQGSSSADLSRASVSRADGGTVFTCHLLWNATVVASANYTLRVTCSDLIRQARAEGLATGVGIGLGVGLVVALIAVAVHVVVSLRRGSSLLCAAYTTTRRAEAMHSMETSNIPSREGDGVVAAPESGNEGPGLYEDIRRDEVNVPSTYEDLLPQNQPEASAAPSHTETRRVYDNRAFVSDTDQRGDVPAEKKTPKTIREQKQSESADYSNV